MKPSEPSAPRVVLDTQVLLRGAVAKSESLTAKIYDAWRSGRFTLLLSEAILVEIEDVLRRPEVLEKLRFSSIEARGLLILLRRRGLLVRPTAPIRRSRDAADDKFLECAVAGPADYLVSADADLLSLREIQGIPILDVPTVLADILETAFRQFMFTEEDRLTSSNVTIPTYRAEARDIRHTGRGRPNRQTLPRAGKQPTAPEAPGLSSAPTRPAAGPLQPLAPRAPGDVDSSWART